MLQHSDFSADEYRRWIDGQREHTLRYIHVAKEEVDRGPERAELNPPLWEWCHINWFWEYWCLRAGGRTASLLPEADTLFNSATLAHQQRWRCTLPDWALALAYGANVIERVCEQLQKDDVDRYFVELAVHHEAMHEENFMRRAQALAQPFRNVTQEPLGMNERCRITSTRITLGTEDQKEFVFDNERSAHTLELPAFDIANSPVTETEFAEFVYAGGYHTPSWWSEDGLAWLQHDHAKLPRYWRQEDGEFYCRDFTQWRPLHAQHAMRYINFFEAEAYARFCGATLPSAAQWQASSAQLNVPLHWEWTRDPFTAYPGFVAGPYREYSAPSFGRTQELRGRSPLNHFQLARPTFRNFFARERRDVCAGLRLVWQDNPAV